MSRRVAPRDVVFAPLESAALRLDVAGIVAEVVVDRLGLPPDAIGQTPDRLLGVEADAQLAPLLDTVARDGVAINWMVMPGSFLSVPVLFATVARYSGGAICLLATQPEELERLFRAFAARKPAVAAEVVERLPVTEADPLQAAMEEVGRLNSELTANQRELARSNNRLARTNAEMQRMLGVAAHDLRSPLGVISAYSEVLGALLSDRLTPREQAMLESVQTATGFMRRLLDDTLDYAKIQSGTLTLATAETDLGTLVRATVDLQRIVAEQAGRRIELSVTEGLLPLSVDADKIQQVLNNLLANAIRFARDDGVIRVTVEQRGDEIILGVQDDGCGISETDQARLFDPFVQVGKQRSGGAGLGLAICRRIAEAHGGRMSVESTLGAGATFRLHLPLES